MEDQSLNPLRPIVEVLVESPVYVNVLISGGIMLLGIIATIWICAFVFKRMDEAAKRNP